MATTRRRRGPLARLLAALRRALHLPTVVGPTPGQRLREAAYDAAITAAQGRAIAAILAALEVADGGGTDVEPSPRTTRQRARGLPG
ncbi:hypothetical protein H7X46_11555 [Pseudonocardia sp. C8]|uniref:hypothetical protein n=1 Tax=Pseudonocardia sp. C8 TaxID=2762759 RepID=UPI0016429D81|nr:hypothetical protein [Pseudonocardia sp. C8]MBC3191697.1 hypothetical protein [Pseudonocardia sp. C8]